MCMWVDSRLGLRAHCVFLVPQEWVPVVHFFCDFLQEVGRWLQCMYVWLTGGYVCYVGM